MEESPIEYQQDMYELFYERDSDEEDVIPSGGIQVTGPWDLTGKGRLERPEAGIGSPVDGVLDGQDGIPENRLGWLCAFDIPPATEEQGSARPEAPPLEGSQEGEKAGTGKASSPGA